MRPAQPRPRSPCSYLINSSYEPLFRNLPISLAEKAAVTRSSKLPQGEFGGGQGLVYQGAPAQFGGEKRTDNGYGIRSGDADREEAAYPPQQYGEKAPFAATTTSPQQNEIDDEGINPNAFDQPALFEPQRPIWLPHDDLGIAADEIAHLRSLGIDASSEGAFLTAKGKVDTNVRLHRSASN